MISKMFKLIFHAFLFLSPRKIMAQIMIDDRVNFTDKNKSLTFDNLSSCENPYFSKQLASLDYGASESSLNNLWKKSNMFERESNSIINDINTQFYPWSDDLEKENIYLNLLQKLNNDKIVNNGYTIEEQKQMVKSFEEIYQFHYHPNQHMFEKLNLIVHLATVNYEYKNIYVLLSALAVRSLFVASYIEICKEHRNKLPTIKLTSYDKPTNLLIRYRQDHYYTEGDAFLNEIINKMRESIRKNGIPIDEFNHEAHTKLEDNINSSSNTIDIELLKNFYFYCKNFVFQNQYALGIVIIEEILLKYSKNKIKIPTEVVFWLNLIENEVRRESHFLLHEPPYNDFLSDEELAAAIEINKLQTNELINMLHDDTIDSIKIPFARYIGNKIANDFIEDYKEFTPWQLFEIYNDLLKTNPKYISNINTTAISALNMLNKDNIFSDKNLTHKKRRLNDISSLVYQEATKTIIKKLQEPIDQHLYNINFLKILCTSLLLMSLFMRYGRNYYIFLKPRASHVRFIVPDKTKIITTRSTHSKSTVINGKNDTHEITAQSLTPLSNPIPDKWREFEDAITIHLRAVPKDELRVYKNEVKYFRESVVSQQNTAWLDDSLYQKVNLFINQLKGKIPKTSPILMHLNAKLENLRVYNSIALNQISTKLDIQMNNEDEDTLIPDFHQMEHSKILGSTTDAEPAANLELKELPIIHPSSSTLKPVLTHFSFSENPRFSKFASDARIYLNKRYEDTDNKYTQTINRAFKFLIIQFFSSIELNKLEKESANAFTSVRDGICHEWNTIKSHRELNIYLEHILSLIIETQDGSLSTLNTFKRQLELYENNIINVSRIRQNLSIPVNEAINILLKLMEELNTVEQHCNFSQEIAMLAAADICAQIGETLKYARPHIADLAQVTHELITLRRHAYHNQMTADEIVKKATIHIESIKKYFNITPFNKSPADSFIGLTPFK